MPRTGRSRSILFLAGSVAIVALGVAGNTGFDSPSERFPRSS